MSTLSILRNYANAKFDNIKNRPYFNNDLNATDGLLHSTGINLGSEVINQSTDITTDVVANVAEFTLVTQGATAAAGASHSFTIFNNECSVESNIFYMITEYSGSGIPYVLVTSKAVDGLSFDVTITNIHTADALDDTITVSFLVTKA